MKKILVVDDDKDVLYNMNILLTNKGYEIKMIDNGYTAITVAETFLPDIILLDIHLHNYDGREICRKLKHNFITKRIPVIMMSVDMNKKDILEKYEANDFLEKPFNVSVLYDKISSFIGEAMAGDR
jgi:CheY-like chemotaxis protein